MKTKLKAALMKKMLVAQKKQNPFHEKLAELYCLPEDAPANFNNSYYFSAHMVDGESLFLRLGLRSDGSCEVWSVYKKGDIFFQNPQTVYENAADSPLSVACLESGKRWGVSYHGPMTDCSNGQEVHCALSCTFTATDPIFDFTYHMNPTTTAVAMAQEKWSKELFAEMQENKQTHYEQNGHLEGALALGDREILIDMNCVRDHSFGKRDWNYMNKHYWLMALAENGDMINISMVSYPALHHLDAGNVILGGKTLSIVQVIPHGDFINDGKGPNTFHITCVLENGRKITVYGEKETEVVYPLGDGYILREGLGTYSIDGRKARGIVEFGFNHDRTRW